MNRSAYDLRNIGAENPKPVHAVIAIDGPAASGKSSVSRLLARRLDFAYVNSGSLYRAVAWNAHRGGISPEEPSAILEQISGSHFEFGIRNKESFVLIGGFDPGPFLQGEQVNRTVSLVSAIPDVRTFIVDQLRRFANLDDLIMEGRDIGSVVFADTPYKFYIDASPEVRAQRRSAQGLQDEISKRDRIDTSRATAPLTIASDATVIDSSQLTVEGVVCKIVDRLKDQKLRQATSL
jgi:cytidylate kinase